MRILFASDVYPPYISGVAVYTRDVKEELKKRGIKVKAVVPGSKLRLKQDIITVPSIPSFYPSLRVGIPCSVRAYQQIKNFGPDIIHTQTQGIIGLWALLIAKKLKKPLIGTFHTYFLYENLFEELGIRFLYPFFDKAMWVYNRWFYNRLDGLISPSKRLIAYLKKNGIKIPIVYIPNPIDLKWAKKKKINKKVVKKKFRLDKKNILYVGRVSGEKNLDDLIRAFKTVQESHPQTKFILVGSGPSLSYLKRLIKELGLVKSIVFAGRMKREKLLGSGLFETVDLFATASQSENQPLTIIEAMAFGLPIAGVRAMGMPELVTNNGLLSPPGNIKKLAKNINLLLDNRELRKKMGRVSKQNVAYYDIRRTTDKLIAYYQSFLV